MRRTPGELPFAALYLLTAFLTLAVSCAGCGMGERGHSSTSASTTSANQQVHVPGEAEHPAESEHPAEAEEAAWCGEHGVPESMCTKCSPRLIPDFQKKGDWCGEHGFPMSVCPVHHPDPAHPAMATPDDGAPADGMMIRFKSLETARRSGVQVVAAAPGGDGAGVTASARIVADPSGTARVNASASGVVRTLLVGPGTTVAAGTPLAALSSAEVGAARSRMRSTTAKASVAEAAYQRQRDLFEKGMTPRRELESAEEAWETARAEAEAASAALTMMGVSPDGSGADGAYLLRSPIRGTVTASLATVGAMVDAEEPLFEIVDASRLWAEIDVPERDARLVAPGQRVILRADGLPGQTIEATVHSIAPVIDPHTRSAKARARITSATPGLRANMYARATVRTPAGGASALVPRDALQESNGIRLVFVRLREDQYETRRVEATLAEDGMVAIQSGVRVGEPVVTTGSFLLKTETLKGSIGTGCCVVEPRTR